MKLKRRLTKEKNFLAVIVIFVALAFFGHMFFKKKINDKIFIKGSNNLTSVHFVDVGQGDCELILDGDKSVLIDCGEVDSGSKVVKHLKKCGVKTIDYFIGTHPHTDHIGGFLTVARHFKVKNVILPEIPLERTPTTPVYEKFLNFLKFSGKTRVLKAKVGETFKLNKGYFKIMGPVRNDYEKLNDFSVVCKYVIGDCSFMFCGDAETAAERDLILSRQNLKADVLKLSHHGSRTSNTAKFLKEVDAKIYVAEVGRNNSYGHPHKKVLKAIKNKQLFRTDLDGTIVFKTNGKLIDFEKEKN